MWLQLDRYRGVPNDPISMHRYQYVKNDPIKYLDSYGYEPVTIAGVTISSTLLLLTGVGLDYGLDAYEWAVIYSIWNNPESTPEDIAYADGQADDYKVLFFGEAFVTLGLGLSLPLDDVIRWCKKGIDFKDGKRVADPIFDFISNRFSKNADEVADIIDDKVDDIIDAGDGVVDDGVDTLSRGSTGRTFANNLEEQLFMKSVKSNPLEDAIELEKIQLKDTRWLYSEGWVKMKRTYKTNQGQHMEIHFVYNKLTKVFDDFKFID